MKLFKQKVGKYLPIFILTGILLYQAYAIVERFFSEQTFMESSFYSQTDTTFPEITFCAKAKHEIAPAFWKAYNISHKNWKAQITSKEMYEEVTFSKVPDIIDEFYLRFFEANQDTGAQSWSFKEAIHEEAESFFRKRSHPRFGQCATLIISDDVKSYGYYYSYATMRFKEENDIITFIHKSDNFWKTTLQEPGIVTNFRTEAQVQTNYEEIKEIKTAHNPCMEQSMDVCFEDLVTTKLNTTIGCLPPWIDLEGLPYCNTAKLILKADKILQEVVDNFDATCKSTCHYLIITSGSRNFEPDKNKMRTFLYFPYKIQYRVEDFVISRLKLVAELGGYAGLLLGVSFFHLAKLAGYVIDWRIAYLKSKYNI